MSIKERTLALCNVLRNGFPIFVALITLIGLFAIIIMVFISIANSFGIMDKVNDATCEPHTIIGYIKSGDGPYIFDSEHNSYLMLGGNMVDETELKTLPKTGKKYSIKTYKEYFQFC